MNNKIEPEYPDGDEKLISRIRYLIELSETIDFDEELNEELYFRDPDYDGKSIDWKLFYSMGKDAVDAATLDLKEWLEELLKERK